MMPFLSNPSLLQINLWGDVIQINWYIQSLEWWIYLLHLKLRNTEACKLHSAHSWWQPHKKL
jgi:hypothetical protein